MRLERSAAEVPSRVADNLYWLGRYTERLEDTVRLLRSVLSRLAEVGAEETADLTALVRLLAHLDLFPDKFRERHTLASVEREVYSLIYQPHRLGAVREVRERLSSLAFALRDRFSPTPGASSANCRWTPVRAPGGFPSPKAWSF